LYHLDTIPLLQVPGRSTDSPSTCVEAAGAPSWVVHTEVPCEDKGEDCDPRARFDTLVDQLF